jgi:hypothetical protein
MKWAEQRARMGHRKVAYRALVGKSERKNSLVKHSSERKGDIKMNLEV